MSDPAPHGRDAIEYQCPTCGQPVGAGTSPGEVLQCPHCGGQFFVPDESRSAQTASTLAEGEHDAAVENDAPPEVDLSELRIRQVSSLRRGAYRTRSWLIIGALTCGVGFCQLVYIAVRDWRLGLRLGPIIDLVLAVLAVALFRSLLRRIRMLNREIEASRQQDPATPPDLSSLSDGSQRWANLDALSHPTDET